MLLLLFLSRDSIEGEDEEDDEEEEEEEEEDTKNDLLRPACPALATSAAATFPSVAGEIFSASPFRMVAPETFSAAAAAATTITGGDEGDEGDEGDDASDSFRD